VEKSEKIRTIQNVVVYSSPKSFVRMRGFVRRDSGGIPSHNPNRIAIAPKLGLIYGLGGLIKHN
jgi:hypothetical protein